jgi:alpha-beta hydrolase superfamily lysophospholipase
LADPAFTIETHTASDGYRWQYRHYIPTLPARARVVCLHGIQSHGGWYEHSSKCLRDAGFEVFFLDRRGSGMNRQDRGDTPGFRWLLSDIAEFIETLREPPADRSRGSRLKVFLLGISWGGKLAAGLVRRNFKLVDGLILLCPGFFPKIGLSMRKRLAILWARLVEPTRRFPIPLDDPELFTAAPRWIQFIRTDPMSLHEATARFLMESVRLDGYLRLVGRYVCMPVLLMLAEQDRIIDNWRTRRLVERLQTPLIVDGPAFKRDTQIIEYPAAHHTLEFEPEPERFIRDLISWLEKHLV